DSGVFVKNHVGLGHTRLSIIDLSTAGHQPMANKDATLHIVFNGEIYNFKELRSELESLGHVFVSKTDTEVILYAYQEWGAKCVEKFSGMFAFVIFDETKSQLFLARDRIGEKPLYYYQDQEKFVFGSEIKAILEDISIVRQVDAQGLSNYVAFGHSIAPDTMYRGIKKLLPGHYMVFENGRADITKYWDSRVVEEPIQKEKEYYIKKIQELFEASVKERLISDVPLGVFLSGGLDSSAVVAMMAKHQTSPIKTFSIGFNVPGTEFNELADAKIVADYFKTDHHEIILQEQDLIDALPELVYHFDEPFADAAAFPVFLLSKFAKQHVSVALTGDGGDEIFGGYRRYAVEKHMQALSVPGMLAAGFYALPGLRKTKKLLKALAIKNPLERYASWISFFSPDMQEQLFVANQPDALGAYKKHLSKVGNGTWLDKIMYLDQKILLPDAYLEKVDKMSMAFGLETRAPMLDHKLVEFANSMPAKYKIKGLTTKYLFREAMKGILPASILNKKKHGFAVPINPWFRGKLKEYLFEVIFDPKTRARGYFNYAYIEKLHKMYQNGNQPLDSQFWLLLNFELWHRKFIDT
ncbi:MAG: asparagine synthase (glutamine-hydrolyzing), partial [Candidatus Staskawiczbacteria bacterium]|nr:asparagine synthase (glutamine-hydrolyzing) [Candidatus Staskawiczbacteria bacterium]